MRWRVGTHPLAWGRKGGAPYGDSNSFGIGALGQPKASIADQRPQIQSTLGRPVAKLATARTVSLPEWDVRWVTGDGAHDAREPRHAIAATERPPAT